MKRRSLALPVLLIGLGAIFLISNAFPGTPIWSVLIEWWPVLLIAFGVIRLIEVLALYGTGRATAGGTRPLGFGWIFVAIALAALAAGQRHFSRHFNWNSRDLEVGWNNLVGEDFSYPVTAETGLGDVHRIVFDGVRGSITVNGSEIRDVKISGRKNIHAGDKNAADRASDQAQLIILPEGDTLFVRSAEPPDSRHGRVTFDLEVAVPKTLSVEARGRSGDLEIHAVDGNVDAAVQRGELRLENIGGSVKAEVDHASLIRASGMKGNLDLNGIGNDVQLEGIDGLVTIHGRFGGTLDFKSLKKPLHFESEQTDLRVERIPGSISVSLSELRGQGVEGPFHLVTHTRDVNLDGYQGPLEIELGRGDVSLKPDASATLARVDVRSRSGDIDMALPPDHAFNLQGTAQQGEVSNDFGDGIVSESGKGRTNTLRSANPSGPVISLVSERGVVTVRKLE